MMYHWCPAVASWPCWGRVGPWTLSDLGQFLEPVLIGRTAFMPNQRFIVVNKADRDLVHLRLVWERCLFYLKRGGNSCTAPPLTHTVPPASLLALPNTLIATAVCVCVCAVWMMCKLLCDEWNDEFIFLVVSEQENECIVWLLYSVVWQGGEVWVEQGDVFDSCTAVGET